MIKVRDRPFEQRDARLLSVAGSHLQYMIDEIKMRFHAAVAAEGHHGGGESVRRNVQRDVPPVIEFWSEFQAGLADDLGPEMQRIAGLLPFFERKRRPITRSQVRPRPRNTIPTLRRAQRIS